jgi:hypothetical protein
MEILVKPEILTSYIYMDLRLTTLRVVSFYLLHNVSTLHKCRKLCCGIVVCKHFANYQVYTNYRWDLTLNLLMSYINGAPCIARNFNVVYIYIYIYISGLTCGNAESRLFLFAAQCFNIESMQKNFPVSQLCVNPLPATKVTLITDGI